VAGMLRSFDYAARVVERSLSTSDETDAELIDARAQEWSERNKNHFLFAYAGGELSHEQQVLLSAYVADKAVYETVYETRNRPSWVTIPLQAVARIGAA
jgi:maltokinase